MNTSDENAKPEEWTRSIMDVTADEMREAVAAINEPRFGHRRHCNDRNPFIGEEPQETSLNVERGLHLFCFVDFGELDEDAGWSIYDLLSGMKSALEYERTERPSLETGIAEASGKAEESPS